MIVKHGLLHKGRRQAMILRRLFGPKRYENGEWRRLHNEELHSLYRSSNTVRVIKSRRLTWACHVAGMEEGRSAFKILTGKPTGKTSIFSSIYLFMYGM